MIQILWFVLLGLMPVVGGFALGLRTRLPPGVALLAFTTIGGVSALGEYTLFGATASSALRTVLFSMVFAVAFESGVWRIRVRQR